MDGIEFISYASGSKGNLYRLTDGTTSLLIDPGLPIKKIREALDFCLSETKYALLTHSHADHSKGAKGIIRAGIDLYAHEETIKSLGLREAIAIGEREQITLGSWTVRALPVPHDVPNMAYLLLHEENKCLFIIDAEYCPYKIPGLTQIFIGINYDKQTILKNVENGRIKPALANRIMQNHMSLDTALDFFRAQDMSKLSEIFVLHASEANMDIEKAKDSIQRLTGKAVTVC